MFAENERFANVAKDLPLLRWWAMQNTLTWRARKIIYTCCKISNTYMYLLTNIGFDTAEKEPLTNVRKCMVASKNACSQQNESCREREMHFVETEVQKRSFEGETLAYSSCRRGWASTAKVSRRCYSGRFRPSPAVDKVELRLSQTMDKPLNSKFQQR